MKARVHLIFFGASLLFLSQSCGKTTGSAPEASQVSGAIPGPKIIFATAAAGNGNAIGGIAAGDAACLTDANKPSGGGTYKALLVGSSRTACTTANCSGGAAENTDWVLSANTTYIRSDGTEIGTTNSAGIFTFPLTNAFDTASTNAWTGLNSNWTTNGNTCGSWTVGASSGQVGQRNSKNSSAIGLGQMGCSTNSLSYFCVQQ